MISISFKELSSINLHVRSASAVESSGTANGITNILRDAILISSLTRFTETKNCFCRGITSRYIRLLRLRCSLFPKDRLISPGHPSVIQT